MSASKEEYYQFLSDVESVEPSVYYDTKGIPTIGVGFNISDLSNRNFVRNQLLYDGRSGDDLIKSYAGYDTIYAGEGMDVVFGGSEDDIIYGGKGDDVLRGGFGNDTYILEADNGSDTIENQGFGRDKAIFSDASSDSLWFSQSGDDLEISVLGTSDKVTVSNWYDNWWDRVDEFEASNGYVLDKNNVDNLVQAMASFDPPTSASISDDPAVNSELEPILAANWSVAG